MEDYIIERDVDYKFSNAKEVQLNSTIGSQELARTPGQGNDVLIMATV